MYVSNNNNVDRNNYDLQSAFVAVAVACCSLLRVAVTITCSYNMNNNTNPPPLRGPPLFGILLANITGIWPRAWYNKYISKATKQTCATSNKQVYIDTRITSNNMLRVVCVFVFEVQD